MNRRFMTTVERTKVQAIVGGVIVVLLFAAVAVVVWRVISQREKDAQKELGLNVKQLPVNGRKLGLTSTGFTAYVVVDEVFAATNIMLRTKAGSTESSVLLPFPNVK